MLRSGFLFCITKANTQEEFFAAFCVDQVDFSLDPYYYIRYIQFLFQDQELRQSAVLKKIREHAAYILVLATSEYRFIAVKSSLLAAAAVLAAINGLSTKLQNMAASLSKIIHSKQSDIVFVADAIDKLIESHRKFYKSHNFENIEKTLVSSSHNLSPIVA